MVIPRLRSSGALSMEPYSRYLAKPFSAWRLVMAAVRVVYSDQSAMLVEVGGGGGEARGVYTFP
jgi:hypothetical protein